MIEQVKENVKSLLASGKIVGFLGLRNDDGVVTPYLFQKEEELDNVLSVGDLDTPGAARYPMAKLALHLIQNSNDDSVYGVLVRGCDERALNELRRWNQFGSSDRLVKVGIACPEELAKKHECRKPFPDEFVAGEKVAPELNATVREVLEKDLAGRLAYWTAEFDRCIKCYGCRDICPVCFCNVCTLEDDALIKTGELPPENPMFHLTRAVHMAGRCIDCNLCTEVCPAHIPLRTLYKRVAEIITDEFGYVTGEPGEGKSPLNILGPDPGHTSAND
jgi:formate dehydrogenase (coenzyme F420) beta subunit